MADVTPPTTPIWLADEDADGIPDVVDFSPEDADQPRERDPEQDSSKLEQTSGTDADGNVVNRIHADEEYRTDTAWVSEHGEYDYLEEAGSEDGHERLEREVVTVNDDGSRVIETKAYESASEFGVETQRTEHHRMELDASGTGVNAVDIETVRIEGDLRTVSEEHRRDPVSATAPDTEEGADGGAGLFEAVGDWFGGAVDGLSAAAAELGDAHEEEPGEEEEPDAGW